MKQVDNKFCNITADVNHQAIPSIADNPVRLFGSTFSETLSDKYQAHSVKFGLSKGLDLIKNSHHRAV